MAKFTSGHIRTVALVLKNEMPLDAKAAYESLRLCELPDVVAWYDMCRAFALRFNQNNAHFKGYTFYKTCGIEDEKMIQELMKL